MELALEAAKVEALYGVSQVPDIIASASLEAARECGWDHEQDAELGAFCLKATQVEIAEENLKRFKAFAKA
jgi:hypothetical protein